MKQYPKTRKGEPKRKYSYQRYNWWDRRKLQWWMYKRRRKQR